MRTITAKVIFTIRPTAEHDAVALQGKYLTVDPTGGVIDWTDSEGAAETRLNAFLQNISFGCEFPYELEVRRQAHNASRYPVA